MAEQPSPSDPSGAAGTSVSIVRYPNRRFYDRSQGRYVTLQEIAAMIREGKNVTVYDSKTNDDLTGAILTQILLDQHPERMDLFPVPILHVMLRTNEAVLGLLREYFRQSLVYLDFWQKASAFTPMTAPLEWLRAILPGTPKPPVEPAVPSAKGSPAPSATPPPPAESEAGQADVLMKRIAELERRLNALGAVDGEREGAAEHPSGKREPAARRKRGRGRGRSREKK
jgi:polyhydroxyalkanoate synthesis repressor PhaR